MARLVPMVETANELVLKCNTLAHHGANFAIVWEAVLKGHVLVIGLPVQALDDEQRPQLQIRLINSQSLVYNSDSNEYFVSWAQRSRSF
jgi:hypothetical protein